MAPPNRGQEVLSSQHGENVSLAYLQHMSVRRTMEWHLYESISGVSLDKLGE